MSVVSTGDEALPATYTAGEALADLTTTANPAEPEEIVDGTYADDASEGSTRRQLPAISPRSEAIRSPRSIGGVATGVSC